MITKYPSINKKHLITSLKEAIFPGHEFGQSHTLSKHPEKKYTLFF